MTQTDGFAKNVVVQFADKGFVQLTFHLRWWELSEVDLVKLRKVVQDLQTLAGNYRPAAPKG